MQDSTMLAVARYIVESRRNRNYNRTNERGPNSDTQKSKSSGNQRNWDGDERLGTDNSGQSWDNI